MSDPNKPGEISVTIKYKQSEAYAGDNSWIVFHGTVAAVREQIIDAFNLDESANMLALSDIVLTAQSIATSTSNVATKLGGKSLGSGNGTAPKATATQAAATTEPAAPSEPEGLAGEIARLQTYQEATDCWADNAAELKADPDLMAAWKAKAKALKPAA